MRIKRDSFKFRTVYNKKVAFGKPKATSIFILRKPELHHSTHASHSGSTHRHFWLIFLLFSSVRDKSLRQL